MPPRGLGAKKERPKDTRGTILRVLRYLTRRKIALALLLLCTLASNLGNLLGPTFAGKAIGAAADAGQVDFGAVAYYAKAMLAAYLLSNLLSFLVNQAMMRLGRRVANQMRKDVFDKLMKLPVKYFDRNQAGDIICLSADLVQILTSAVTVAGSLFMMLWISPPMVVGLGLTIPMAVAFTRFMGKRTRPLYSKRSASYGRMNGYVEEMFSGQKTILAYAYEDQVCGDFSDINRDAAEAYRAADSLGMITGPTINMINNLGLSLVGMAGAVLYLLGAAGMEQISSFVLYSRKFCGPINEIANIMNEIYSALAAAERVFTLLDQPEEPADAPDALTLDRVDGDVEAEHVRFGYLPDQTVLHDLSFHAEPGKTFAIVGHTGAGKTTTCALLPRFYDVDSGEIRVDGHPLCTVTRASLRRAYAMVLQDTWVFHGTIFDNIAYGKEGATREEVEAAAKAARIHSYIMRLPQGYDTVIQEDGGNISKGQKQLLTIARAMLYDTHMLILDEATSNVDTNTEQQVQRAMQELMKGKTSFVIAHRLSTIQHADKVLVMEHGDVREQGTHEELMKKRGVYYRLYAAQFE